MGLLDKIKDNAKNISIKAIDSAWEEYDDPSSESDKLDYIDTSTAVIEKNTEDISSNDDKPETNEDTVDSNDSKDQITRSPKINSSHEDTDQKDNANASSETKARKSKVTVISKEEHQKEVQLKRQSKVKQEAKERLAKAYVPSYKTAPTNSKPSTKDASIDTYDTEKIEVETTRPEKSPTVRPTATSKSTGIIDITPHKFRTSPKGASYARERAAMTVLASQRKLNGTIPIHTTNHMNFKTKVFVDRIEYSGSFGKNVLPITKVAWIKLRYSGTGVIIETTDGKRVVMVVKPSDRLDFAEAILKVQSLQPKRSKFKDRQTVRIDQLDKLSEGLDELEKLAALFDKGIISQEEFNAKKRQILGL